MSDMVIEEGRTHRFVPTGIDDRDGGFWLSQDGRLVEVRTVHGVREISHDITATQARALAHALLLVVKEMEG